MKHIIFLMALLMQTSLIGKSFNFLQEIENLKKSNDLSKSRKDLSNKFLKDQNPHFYSSLYSQTINYFTNNIISLLTEEKGYQAFKIWLNVFKEAPLNQALRLESETQALTARPYTLTLSVLEIFFFTEETINNFNDSINNDREEYDSYFETTFLKPANNAILTFTQTAQDFNTTQAYLKLIASQSMTILRYCTQDKPLQSASLYNHIVKTFSVFNNLKPFEDNDLPEDFAPLTAITKLLPPRPAYTKTNPLLFCSTLVTGATQIGLGTYELAHCKKPKWYKKYKNEILAAGTIAGGIVIIGSALIKQGYKA